MLDAVDGVLHAVVTDLVITEAGEQYAGGIAGGVSA